MADVPLRPSLVAVIVARPAVTSAKSWLSSGVRVTVLGETTSRLTVGRGSEIASSQLTKAAAAGTTATATTVPALSRARRRASLCKNVIVPSPGDRSLGGRPPQANLTGPLSSGSDLRHHLAGRQSRSVRHLHT